MITLHVNIFKKEITHESCTFHFLFACWLHLKRASLNLQAIFSSLLKNHWFLLILKKDIQISFKLDF